MGEGLRVGVVGGSISGCTAAIELSRADHDVTVYERSVGALEGRGAGIGTPTPTFERLIARDLISASTPRTTLSKHVLLGADADNSPLGRAPLQLPMEMATLHWRDLWSELRGRVADDDYRGGAGVTSLVDPDSMRPGLHFADGSVEHFDLVVCGDGYSSPARRQLFPDATLGYRGYVLWRGILPEAEVADPDPLEDTLFRFSFPRLGGNGVFYFVPGLDGSAAVGERLVNWAHYIPVPAGELGAFLTDKDGVVHRHSLPPGSMPDEQQQRLRELLTDHLPPYFADITTRTEATFAQPIYTSIPDSFHRGRCCLIGDAAAVVPPFTGAGVFKASNNAIDLVEALDSDGGRDVDAALGGWSAAETAGAHRLAAMGEQMEQAFVFAAPDLGAMNEAEANAWWTASISFPDDFTYIADTD